MKRLRSRAGFAAISLLACAPALAALVQGVDSISMTVADAEASRKFYENVLDFEPSADTESSGEACERLYGVFGTRLRTVTLKLGEERLQLQQFLAPKGRPIPGDLVSNDHAFQHVAIIVSDMDKAFARLRAANVQFGSSGPQVLPATIRPAAGIAAFYFRDPDGHFLEILHFPADKGDAKWHVPTSRVFLGIDHTAIVVADTDASLAFYDGVLGMRIAGSSENFGTEQEHLNNVFGARLRITSLRAAQGPGVELLEYLAPRTGRIIPPDTRPNDLWYWHINFSANVKHAEQEVVVRHYRIVSAGAEAHDGAFLANDPDGHAVLIRSAESP